MLRFLRGKGTKAFPLWQRAPYEEIENFYWSISRAPRQWQGATASVNGGNRLGCLREVSGLSVFETSL